MKPCPHAFDDREASVYTEGLCPLCLCALVERYRIAMSWIEDREPRLVEAAREKFGFHPVGQVMPGSEK